MKYKVTIRKDGTSVVEVLEGQGQGCVEATAALELRLGKTEGERVLKAEFQAEREVEAEREYDR